MMMVLLFVLPAETMVQNHTVFQFLEIVQKSSLLVPANDNFQMIGRKHFSSGYSGRGPTTSCVMKPDVVAPGTNIFSCSLNNRYAIKSGTSMATPVVSGSFALLLENILFTPIRI